MKKWIMMLMLPFTVLAQEEPARDPRARQRIEAARIAFITERLGLTPEEAEKFWPVYREFYQKRIELRQQLEQARKIRTIMPPKSSKNVCWKWSYR